MGGLTSYAGLAGIPLVMALVQLVKLTFPGAPQCVWPAVTLGVAVAWNVGLALVLGTSGGAAVLVGLLTGLAASGLYSYATVGRPRAG
jgi:hypothetical protein